MDKLIRSTIDQNKLQAQNSATIAQKSLTIFTLSIYDLTIVCYDDKLQTYLQRIGSHTNVSSARMSWWHSANTHPYHKHFNIGWPISD